MPLVSIGETLSSSLMVHVSFEADCSVGPTRSRRSLDASHALLLPTVNQKATSVPHVGQTLKAPTPQRVAADRALVCSRPRVTLA
jgi:hypothetical protein